MRRHARTASVSGTIVAIFVMGLAAGAGEDDQVAGDQALAELVSSIPPFTAVGQYAGFPVNGTLWRSRRHVIRLFFDAPITAPQPGQLLVQSLLGGGLWGCPPSQPYGADVSASFEYTVEGETVLRIYEPSPTSTVLADRHWYVIRNVGDWPGVADFEIQFPVVVGDADGNRFTTPSDVGMVNVLVLGRVHDQSRVDMDGDGFRTSTDVSIVHASQGPPPTKPCGH